MISLSSTAAFDSTTTMSRSAVSARPAATPTRRLVRAGKGRRHTELQSRPGVEAAARRVRRLCDLLQPRRRQIRRHQLRIWRPCTFPSGDPDQLFGPEEERAIESAPMGLFDRRLLVTAHCSGPRRKAHEKIANVTSAGKGRVCTFGLTSPHRGRRRLSYPGHRSRRQRQDHRQLERVRRSGADEVGGDPVAGSVAAADALSRPMWLKLANVAHQSFSMPSKDQLTDIWEFGGQAVYRSEIYGGTFLAANQVTRIQTFGASTGSRTQIQHRTRPQSCLSPTSPTSYLRCPLPGARRRLCSSRRAAASGWCFRHGSS